jgi:Flp pilus assembly protein TadD/mono/diheme cytochrome c family protein
MNGPPEHPGRDNDRQFENARSPAPSQSDQMKRLAAWIASCVIPGAVVSTAFAGRQTTAQVTFSADIAPILFAHCAGCHRPDGDAPFSLLTYSAARQRASVIAKATRARLMPPWKSEPGYGEFIGHDRLTDSEIDLIERWVAAGVPEGDPRVLPSTPAWSGGWQLGQPDLTVSFPEPYLVPAAGSDFSRIFVVHLPVTEQVYVKGFEFRPGRGGVVHHANIRIDRTSRSRELDQDDPAPGYSGLLLSSAVYPDGHFLGWTPGQVAPLLPNGLAWPLTPGTDLVVEIHFVPNGRVQAVQPAVGLYFTKEPPQRTPAMLRLGRQNIEIAAGEKRYVTADSFVLPVDVEVHAVQPHAHYRAREVKGTATLPDGTSRPLIYIKDWDYRWQHVYRYVTPLTLPKGTTIDLRYVFDNSAENVRNPQQPPQPVHWGQRSTDEMGDLWVQMLTRTDQDLRLLKKELQAKHVAEEVVGYEMMIHGEPANVALRNDAAVVYTEIGQLNKAVPHLQAVVQLQPDSPTAHYNLGTTLSAIGNVTGAVVEYRQALRLRPDYALAHNNLGHALLSMGRTDDADHHFREAARLDPGSWSAQYNIGLISRARGDIRDAIDRLQKAVRLRSDWVQAVGQLAWILATTPSATLRDADRAVQLAEHAAALTNRRNAGVLDVLAAAQAAAGQFDVAVISCDEALAQKPEQPLADAIEQRRALYSQHRAYVSPQ